MNNRKDIGMIYFEKVTGKQSMEEAYLLKQSKETFSGNADIKIKKVNDPCCLTTGSIIQETNADIIAICIDNSVFHSTNWTDPLINAIKDGFELVSPVCSDIFNIDMPYYTPLTFDIVANHLKEKYKNKYITEATVPLLSFLVKRSALIRLNSNTPLSDLPQILKSCLVPASLVHKFADYYSSKREDLMPFIPHGVKKVLDVGCARGYFGEIIKKERGCEVFGVELNPLIAKEAEKRLDRIFCMNIESDDLPFNNEIDVIIFADLLEHLIDPWLVLKKARRWLKPYGIVIASIPNTAHYSIIHDLLHGKWDYVPFGLLCITHLRFFTKSSIEAMFNEAGFSILTIKPQTQPESIKSEIKNQLSAIINTTNISDEIFNHGYYIVAQ